MDFAYSEEQEELRELARRILGDLATHERLKQLEATGAPFDQRLWGELAAANLLGVCVPEAYGGMGLGFFDLTIVLEEVGAAVAPIPAVPTLVAAVAVAEFGTDAQKTALLPGVVAGDTLLTCAVAEEALDDPAAPGTFAHPDGAGWRLDGAKITVPYAAQADRAVVVAAAPGGSAGLFLVDAGTPGVTVETEATTDRQPHGRLVFDNAAAEVLAGPGEGEPARWLTDRLAAALCAVQVGVCDRAVRMAAEYTSGREQFDRPIGSFQAVHQRVADIYVDVLAMRLTALQAAWRLSEGLAAADEVAIAKFWAAEGGYRAVLWSQHLHGGIGVDVDYPLHRYYLWEKQIELSLGAANAQLSRLGRSLASR
jgi:alkylation response protein AidB-like acyl-CoA dehydrogenase